MQDVPARAAHIPTAAPRRMVAEAVYDGVPYGTEMIDEESFRQGDPYWDHYQETALKLVQREILDLFDGLGVIA